MAAYQTIFASDLGQTLLLFVLLFTIIFAILQKAKVLGEGKQINALVALSMALLVSGVGYVLEFTQKIIPLMSVIIVIILVFLILSAFFFKGEIDFGKSKWWFSALMGLIVIIAVIIFTGSWDMITSWFGNSEVTSNIVLIVIVGIIVAFVYMTTKSSEGKKE